MATVAFRNCGAKLPRVLHSSLVSRPQALPAGSRPSIPSTIISRPQSLPRSQAVFLHTSTAQHYAAPKSKDRGPKSDEDTQTDFGALNILSNTPVPTTAVDACLDDGFALDSGLKVTGAGVMLVSGEAFKWRPWVRADDGTATTATGRLRNNKGQWEVDAAAWGVLDIVWPKPDLLVIGTGKSVVPLSPATRDAIHALGVRIEVQDTRNAAAQFNLLATERGVQQVAAALVPIGWKEGQ